MFSAPAINPHPIYPTKHAIQACPLGASSFGNPLSFRVPGATNQEPGDRLACSCNGVSQNKLARKHVKHKKCDVSRMGTRLVAGPKSPSTLNACQSACTESPLRGCNKMEYAAHTIMNCHSFITASLAQVRRHLCHNKPWKRSSRELTPAGFGGHTVHPTFAKRSTTPMVASLALLGSLWSCRDSRTVGHSAVDLLLGRQAARNQAPLLYLNRKRPDSYE